MEFSGRQPSDRSRTSSMHCKASYRNKQDWSVAEGTLKTVDKYQTTTCKTAVRFMLSFGSGNPDVALVCQANNILLFVSLMMQQDARKRYSSCYILCEKIVILWQDSSLLIILMKLIYKFLMSYSGTIEGVQPKTTIRQLKTLLYALHGFLPKQTRLVCNGKNAQDGRQISHYKMQDGGTIYVILHISPP